MADILISHIENEIDLEIIDDLISMNSEDDPTFFQNQRNIFINYTKEILSNLSSAVEEDRRSDIKKLAHSLAGSCANFGAIKIAENCSYLENNASILDKEQIKSTHVTIGKNLELFFEYLKSINLTDFNKKVSHD